MDRRFGFIHDKLDIKILILFILQRLPEAISMDALADLTLCDEGISYFDFAECVAELVKTEHIIENDSTYAITEKGRQNGKITENSIPYSVRIKAERSTAALRCKQNRSSMIQTSQTPRQGGVTVNLSMSDGIDNIISMELFAGNETQAYTIEKNFQKNAEQIYHQMINILLQQ